MIWFLTDQIPGQPGTSLPRFLPGDSALREQCDDTFSDLLIDVSIHRISFSAVQPAEAGFASGDWLLAASADGGWQPKGNW
jgi:hypothetical protein